MHPQYNLAGSMAELSPWLTLLTKVGVVIGACLVGYLVVKIIVGLLADVVAWSSPESRDNSDQPTAPDELVGELIESVPGLHVLSHYPSEHRLVDKKAYGADDPDDDSKSRLDRRFSSSIAGDVSRCLFCGWRQPRSGTWSFFVVQRFEEGRIQSHWNGTIIGSEHGRADGLVS